MSQAPASPSPPISVLRFFARQLSPVQRKSLLAAIVATVGGFAGTVMHWIGRRETGDAAVAPGDSWTSWMSSTALGWGLAFIAAFVIAFVVRRFIFKALGILLVVTAAAGAVSYFTGVNIDLSRAQEAYEGAAGWISHQASALMQLIRSNFGGAAAAAVGGFLGARRG